MYIQTMNKDAIINLRISQSLKEAFQAVADAEGFSMSELLVASAKDIVKRGRVPINIRSKIERRRSSILTIPFIKRILEMVFEDPKYAKVKGAFLFGSYAKGRATPASDVDLFLELDEGFTLFDLEELNGELEAKMHKSVDISTNDDDSYFCRHIQKERIRLYERKI